MAKTSDVDTLESLFAETASSILGAASITAYTLGQVGLLALTGIPIDLMDDEDED